MSCSVLLFVSLFVPLITNASISNNENGGTVGNPGDTVICRPSPTFPFHPARPSYFSLDYALSIGWGENPQEFLDLPWSESSFLIASLLAKAAPELSPSFTEFRAFVEDLYSRGPSLVSTLAPNALADGATDALKRKWKKKLRLPISVGDRGDISALPRECKNRVALPVSSEFFIYRAILRKGNIDTITYEYDPRILAPLIKEKSPQFSLMMVHEWLWDHTDDIEIVRRVTLFLHKKRSHKLNPQTLRTELREMGLRI